MTLKLPSLRILLIMRDAPDTEAHKGGLYPTAIQHHVDLGFDVHVASISEMTRQNEDIIRSLGATPFVPSSSLKEVLGTTVQSLLGKGKRQQGPDMTSQRNRSRIAKEVSPHVITGLQSYQTGLIAREIACALDIKYVTWEHLSSYESGRALSQPDQQMVALFEDSHAVLTVSSSLRRAINSRFSIALKNASVLPNPIPTGFTDPLETDAPDWLKKVPQSDFVFAAWTTWRNIKRLDLLLHAFERILSDGIQTTLVLAGPVKDDTAKVIAAFLRSRSDIADSIIFTGDVDREAIRHLSRAADCCVISSDVETFGLSMVEAISVGTPVVSTKCGGPEDILGDERLGVLCEKNNVDALTSAMRHVIDQQDTYKSTEIAQIADKLLGTETILAKWSAVYKDISPTVSTHHD